MSEKEAYIHEWIRQVSKERPELGGFAVCPYASNSNTLIVETTIDGIVPKSGYDVIVFILKTFGDPIKLKNGSIFTIKSTHIINFLMMSRQETHL